MKKLIILLSAANIVACYNDVYEGLTSANTNNSATYQSQTQSSLQEGTWRISLFSENGQDKGSKFPAYAYIIDSFLASNQANNCSNSMSFSEHHPSGSGVNDIDLKILFNLSNDFLHLNDNWDIFSLSSSKIEERCFSGGNEVTDLLTFEKI